MRAKQILSLLGLTILTVLFSCSKEDSTPKKPTALYFMDSSEEIMQKLALDGTGTVTKAKSLTAMAGVGIAYDDVHNKIYFSDFNDATTPDGKIWRMNPDSSGLEAIVTGILDPYGIALDVADGKVYWVDDAGNVSRANLDGTSKQIGIINITDGMNRAIAIDKANNKLYFYEVNYEKLYVANLDGTDPTVLISGVYGYAIFIDTKNHKIYFDDQNTPGLMMANMDGTGIVQVDNVDTRIYGIAIDYDFNKLYWSGRDAGEISMANLNGTAKESLKSGLTSPRGIFLKW
jgi:DNA-binding beta-propeller fold protein YncE